VLVYVKGLGLGLGWLLVVIWRCVRSSVYIRGVQKNKNTRVLFMHFKHAAPANTNTNTNTNHNGVCSRGSWLNGSRVVAKGISAATPCLFPQ